MNEQVDINRQEATIINEKLTEILKEHFDIPLFIASWVKG
jgi:hypothetical protein